MQLFPTGLKASACMKSHLPDTSFSTAFRTISSAVSADILRQSATNENLGNITFAPPTYPREFKCSATEQHYAIFVSINEHPHYICYCSDFMKKPIPSQKAFEICAQAQQARYTNFSFAGRLRAAIFALSESEANLLTSRKFACCGSLRQYVSLDRLS